MTIQTVNNETLIRIPSTVNFAYLQDFINYLSVKTIISKSQAQDSDITAFAEEAQENWWLGTRQT